MKFTDRRAHNRRPGPDLSGRPRLGELQQRPQQAHETGQPGGETVADRKAEPKEPLSRPSTFEPTSGEATHS